MRAAVTTGPGTMVVQDVPEPGAPGEREVLVAPEAVGICGSDFHFFDGSLTEAAGGGLFPRILGHEVGGVVEAVGPGSDLAVGQRVAMWPLHACGDCYPCTVGRDNACDHFALTGIHEDGGLQERLMLPASHVFPTSAGPTVAALAEPMSIAVRAVNRARIVDGERVVVLGAGPIGQCVLVAARDRGASVLMVDPVERRLEFGRALGAETLAWTDREDVVARARGWRTTRPEGPPVVVDATGVPDAVRAAVDMAASAGRVAQVGMSGAEVPIRIGSLTEKELDLLGVSCCGSDEFREAVALVERHSAALQPLISHEFPLERAPEALVYAMEHPTEVMKVVITGA